MSPTITSPPWMPMPKRSGSRRSWLRNLFSSSTLTAICAAARSACRQASRRLTASPNSASMPSPTNWFGLRHRAEEAVDDEDGVERQPLLGKLRRAAHIHEHADEVTLLADPRRVGVL